LSLGPRLRRVLVAAGIALAVLALFVAIGAPMGLFSGRPPADLGLAAGKLRGGDGRPNWVSSQVPASDAKHHVAPFDASGDPATAWKSLERAISLEPRAKVVTRLPGYLHVEFASAAMGFVDDAEFALDATAGVIHLRAGARLGIRDFGVNRERIERLRAAVEKRR
jgi:uncharacterized protein (DUF1499 family)